MIISKIKYPPELLQMKLERSKQFEFLQNDNRSLSQVALAYILSRDEISTCIPGVKSSKQLSLLMSLHLKLI